MKFREKKQIMERFKRDLPAAIKAHGIISPIEILAHGCGIVSVMDMQGNMKIFFSHALWHCNEREFSVPVFCRHAKIGTAPYYIGGELSLKDFLKRTFSSKGEASWQDSHTRVAMPEEILINMSSTTPLKQNFAARA